MACSNSPYPVQVFSPVPVDPFRLRPKYEEQASPLGWASSPVEGLCP